MSNAARLLEVVRDAVLHHEDLAAALRQSDLPGIERAVAQLQAGEPLTRAISGLVPPHR
jgi:hypothetical protein